MKITVPYLKPTTIGFAVTQRDTYIYGRAGPAITTRRTDQLYGVRPAQFTALDYDFKAVRRLRAVGASLAVVGLAVGLLPLAIGVNAYVFFRETFRDTRDILSLFIGGLRDTLGAMVNPK